jgi:hypothetical protein
MFFRSKTRLPRPSAYFDSHTQQWHEVGLGEQIDTGRTARARSTLIIVGLLLAGVLIVFSQRRTLFPGHATEVRIATVVALVVLGITLAGRSGAPWRQRSCAASSRAPPARLAS